jgi:hypothetical protein
MAATHFQQTAGHRRDRLYSGTVEIDEDVRAEYWSQIRGLPENSEQAVIRAAGSVARG